MLKPRNLKPLTPELKAEHDAIAEKANKVSSPLSRRCFPGMEDKAEKINAEIVAFNAKLAAAGISRHHGFVTIMIPPAAAAHDETETPATVTETERKLISLGFTVWEKGGRRRIYVNAKDFDKVFGLEISCYKTGSISYAALNGEKISNSMARRLIGYRTPYYDCVAGEWRDNNMSPII